MPAISVRGRHDSHYYSIAPICQLSTGNFGISGKRTTNTNDTGMWPELSTSYPQPQKLSTVYLQALVGFSRAPQNLSQSPCIFGILAPYPPISTGGSHGLVPGCLDVDNPAMTVSMMPSWLCVDNDEQPWSVDNDTIDIMMPLDSLDTICLDLSLYCIYIIASNEDMSTTLYAQ